MARLGYETLTMGRNISLFSQWVHEAISEGVVQRRNIKASVPPAFSLHHPQANQQLF